MALSAGSVTVDPNDLSRSGSGLALDLYDDVFKPADATLKGFPKKHKFNALNGAATIANSLATALIDHITANAVVTVTVETSDSGLQRTPNPNNADTDTQGPSASKNLSGTIA